MATYEPTGTELVNAEYRPESHWVMTGSLASVTRTFRVVDPEATDSVFEAAVTEAKSGGWLFESEGGACKWLGPGVALLSIHLDDDRSSADPHTVQLRIQLGYDRRSLFSDNEGSRFIEPDCPRLEP